MHYYNDDGGLGYAGVGNELLNALYLELDMGMTDEEQRNLVMGTAAAVKYDYDIHASLGGLSGLGEWENVEEEDGLRHVLKKMIFKTVRDGLLYQEFLLVAWEAVCRIQIEIALSGEG